MFLAFSVALIILNPIEEEEGQREIKKGGRTLL